jgi:ubiquinone/menaquinone biosynthesis C-methylase UbiE
MTRPSHSGSVSSFFDGQARGWSKFYRAGAEMEHRRLRFADALKRRAPHGAAVLDLGCGSGEISRACADAGFDVTGCDISPRMLRIASSRHSGERCRFVRADPRLAPVLPFEDRRFDAVIASSMLEYVPDAGAQLREIRRVLKPGGWLLATVPDMRHPERAAEGAGVPRAPWWNLRAIVRARRTSEYLRLSVQRVAPARWLEWLRAAGLDPEAPAESGAPLLMLEARRGSSGT